MYVKTTQNKWITAFIILWFRDRYDQYYLVKPSAARTQIETLQVSFDPETRPGVSNLVTIHCLADDKLPEEAVLEAEGLTTAQYKRVVAAALQRALAPVRERAAGLRARPQLLRDVLRHGAARARERADQVYGRAAALVGLTGGGGGAAWAPGARATAPRAAGGEAPGARA